MQKKSTHYELHKGFLLQQEINYLHTRLNKEIPWTQVRYYKPERGYVITPRLTWACGFHQKTIYPLMKGMITPNPIPEWLLPLKSLVEDTCGQSFNFMLFSKYRDEKDSITFHSDDERFLGFKPKIASLSLGATRPFILKNKITKQKQIFLLETGDLFLMKNNCQRDYLHSVPKQKDSIAERISITFRKALNEYGSCNYYMYNTLQDPLLFNNDH